MAARRSAGSGRRIGAAIGTGVRCHHPDCPTLWLITDERLGDGLWTALDRLPRGGGVIFRHYSLPTGERRILFAQIARVARRRGLILARAGTTPMRGEQGVHGRSLKQGRGLRTWPAHNLREVIAGRRARADAILISPVFPTRSHAAQRPLGVMQAARLAQAARGKAVALGGMNPSSFRRLGAAGFIGWAAIDGWLGNGPTRR
ncbi:MAG: thiamine phosphate synthase [Sphingomonas sp.]|nr:thiamine phosphate synthase [Sphingomonas sp.]